MAIPKEFNIPMFGCEQGLATLSQSFKGEKS